MWIGAGIMADSYLVVSTEIQTLCC